MLKNQSSLVTKNKDNEASVQHTGSLPVRNSLKTQSAKPKTTLPSATSHKTKALPTVDNLKSMDKGFDRFKGHASYAPMLRHQLGVMKSNNYEDNMTLGQWYPAMVNNKIASGTRVTDFGYLQAHCADAKDGEYVLVNRQGDVRLIEQSDMSQDMRAKVDAFKSKYTNAKNNYDNYMKMQKYAQQGSNLVNTNPDDTHQVNSTLDVVCNVAGDVADNFKQWTKLNKESGVRKSLDFSRTAETMAQLAMKEQVSRTVLNKLISRQLGDDWRTQIASSDENVKNFVDADIPSTIKQYMAYEALSDKNAKGSAARELNFLLNNMGETLDWGANAVKGVTMHISGANKDRDYSNESIGESIAKGYAPTWSNSGRRSYAYNTGNGIADLALEIISDPGTIVSVGAGAASKVAAKDVTKVAGEVLTKDLAEQVATGTGEAVAKEAATKVAREQSYNIIKASVKRGLAEGKTTAEIAANIAERTTSPAESVKIIQQALDNSVATKIAKSLNVVKNGIDTVDSVAAMTTPVGVASLGVKSFVKTQAGIKAIGTLKHFSNTTAEQLSKLFADAKTLTEGTTSHPLSVFSMKDLTDNFNINILGHNISGEGKALEFFPDEERKKLIIAANDQNCLQIENALYRNANIDADGASAYIKEISGGKCMSTPEYIDEVTRLAKENGIEDDALYTRLDKLQHVYDNLHTQKLRTATDEAAEEFLKFRNTYFDVWKTTKFTPASYQKFVKFDEFKELYQGLYNRPATYKEYLENIYAKSAPINKISWEDYSKTLAKKIPTFAEYVKEQGLHISAQDLERYEKAQASSQAMFKFREKNPKIAKALDAYFPYIKELHETNYKNYQLENVMREQANAVLQDSRRTSYQDYLKRINTNNYEAFKDVNDRIAESNEHLRALACNAYAQSVDCKMRSAINEFIHKDALFTDAADDVENLKYINSMLERSTLDPEEWRSVFDTIQQTVEHRRAEAYERAGVGVSTLANAPDGIDFDELIKASKKTADEIAQYSGDAYKLTIPDDITEVEGKVYMTKLNDVETTDVYLSNATLDKTYADILNQGELGQLVLEQARNADHSRMTRACSALMDDAYSAQRYLNIKQSIENAQYIPEPLRRPLIDKLFTTGKKTSYLFNSYDVINGSSKISTSAIEAKCRMLAKDLRNDALNLVSHSSEATSIMFRELECNTNDTAQNVLNIAKQYKALGIEHPDRYPVFISWTTLRDSNNISQVSFHSAIGDVTIKNEATGHLFGHEAFFKNFADYVDELKWSASKEHKSVQFIGFNTSSTGYDTAKTLSDQIRLYHAHISLYDMFDVADYMRIQRGLPIMPDVAVDELSDILQTEMMQWVSDIHTTGIPAISASLTPTMIKNAKMTTIMPEHIRFDTLDTWALYKRMTDVVNALEQCNRKVQGFNHNVLSAGLIYSESANNIAPQLQKLSLNSNSMVVATKELYDAKVVSKYFDLSKVDGEKASELFEFSRDCDRIARRVNDYALLYQEADRLKFIYDQVKAADSVAKFMEDNGINLKPDLSTAQEFAVYDVLRSKLNYSERIVITQNICKEFNIELGEHATNAAVLDLFTRPDDMVLGNGKLANYFTDLSGSVVNRDSILHRANSTLQTCETIEQGLTTIESSIEAHEAMLSRTGNNGSLTYLKLQAKSNVTKAMRNFIEWVQTGIRTDNMAAVENFNGNASADVKQMMLNSSGAYDRFLRSSTEFMLQRDKTRFAYIATQTPEDLFAHLLKECGGRMVISREGTDVNVLNELLGKFKNYNRVHIDFVDDKYVRIWYDAKGLTKQELRDIVSDTKGFHLEPIKHTDYTDDAKLYKLYNELAQESPASFTYGMMDVMTPERMEYFNKKFFNDVEDNLLDDTTVRLLGLYDGRYDCVYHGDITNLTVDNIYMSNDMFTNLCNAYGRVMNTLENKVDLLRYTFSPARSFRNFVQNLNDIDGIAGRKNIAAEIDKQGYTVCGINIDKHGGFRVEAVDIHTSKGFNLAMHSDNITCLRYDTFSSLQQLAETENYAMGNYKQTAKLLQFYRRWLRQPFITSYLSTKYATWVHNWIDSPIKAALKEGSDHFSYIFKAIKVKQAYEDLSTKIVQQYGKIDPQTIAEFFNKATDIPMSKSMYIDLHDYWRNPKSGTQLEEALRLFDADPTYVLKKYTDIGLKDADYKKIVELFKEYAKDDTLPIDEKMSLINARLTESYDKSIASKMTGLYGRFENYYKASGMSNGFLSKIPLIKWNAERFNDAETYNRLAIYLKHLDEGDNPGQALLAIGETQFDYTKSDFMKAVEDIAPFTTFKVYNIQYWFDSVWKYGRSELIGDLANLFTYEGGEIDDYWDEDNMSYRAMVYQYINSLEDNDDWDAGEYDSFKDYKGADAGTAAENGWLKIGDKLYFKSGASLIDALNLVYVDPDPTNKVEDQLFAPITALRDVIKALPDLHDQMANESQKDKAIADWVKDNAYNISSLFPVLGSFYYSAYSTGRNYNNAQRDDFVSPQEWLDILAPSLFAPAKDEEKYDKYKHSYYARPVGTDWYNRSDDYKATHRYVVGVSYIPKWVSKDPATYIDTWGRMQQLGLSSDEVQSLMENGGAFWFTENNDGSYSLHNYKLMVGDKQTYYKLLIQLMHYGWTREQAMKLLNEASEPMWDSYKERSTYSGYGSYSNHKTYSYTQRGQRYRTKRSPYVKHVYADKSALYHAQSKMAKYSGSGKWSKYDKRPKSPYGSYVQSRLNAKGHYTYNDSRRFNTQYRKHVRLRNIYKDNYAKYGASRMAMNQNLRAYSNRSITEMYRTNQKSYYTKLKIRRVNW